MDYEIIFVILLVLFIVPIVIFISYAVFMVNRNGYYIQKIACGDNFYPLLQYFSQIYSLMRQMEKGEIDIEECIEKEKALGNKFQIKTDLNIEQLLDAFKQ